MAVVQIAHSIVAGHIPVLAVPGQMGINEADGILYVRDASGNSSPIYLGGPGTLLGLNTSNNSTDGVDIASGVASDAAAPFRQMVLSSLLTKRLTAWAVGSGNGGLDTGVVGDNTYHVFLIRRPDTGVVDGLFSLSPTAPTMPASYTQKRRIASVVRLGGVILPYWQNGDVFQFQTVQTISSALGNRAWSLIAVTAPVLINVQPILACYMQISATGSCFAEVGDARDTGHVNPVYLTWVNVASNTQYGNVVGGFFTDTSAQINFIRSVSGTINSFFLGIRGWIDSRGRT